MTNTNTTANLISTAEFRDYYVLLKPRVMSLVVFTGAVGYLVAPIDLHPVLGVIALFALALGAGAAGAFNMVYERDRDALMERTKNRPLPKGLMQPSDALAFATILAAVALVLMWMSAGVLAAGILAFSMFFYGVVYTMWLKPSTPQNIVIGGAAGAFPPMIGWVTATGALSWDSLVLFGIIFFWTPPHFWALALFSQNDYSAANFPMLPNTHGTEVTKKHILVYSLFLFPLGLVPYFIGTVNEIYLIAAIILGGRFAHLAWQLKCSDDMKDARKLFGFSILYLFVLFGALVLDKYAFMLWSML